MQAPRHRCSLVLDITQRHLAHAQQPPPVPAAAKAAAAAASPPPPRHSVGVALMGYGAIGVPVAAALLDGTHGMGDGTCPCHLSAVLVSTPRPRPPELPPSVVWTADADEFFAADWRICAEAAGQPAVVTHAERTVAAGRDLLVTSVGALTSDALYDSLIDSASTPAGGTLLVAAGAMPAVDWMASASMGVPSEQLDVTCTQTKPPKSWIGARYDSNTGEPAPDVMDFASIEEPVTFFEGTAREAASNYPKNSNIAAMLALATAGLDGTKVKLVADPADPPRNYVGVAFSGPIGRLDVEVEGKQSANPRTGKLLLTILFYRLSPATVCLGWLFQSASSNVLQFQC
jgi:aspartate dehydrogenase